MGRQVYVLGCVLDEAGNVVGTIRSKRGQGLNALRSIFEVVLYRDQPDSGAQSVPMPIGRSLSETVTPYERLPRCSASEHAPAASGGKRGRSREAGVVTARAGGRGADRAATGPGTWRDLAFSLDKYSCTKRDIEAVLRALDISDPAPIIAAHDPYRCAIVLRAAGAKNGRLRKPAAWVLAALRNGWNVDEY